MIRATHDILELAGLLDKEKDNISKINRRQAISALNRDGVSMFVLYYSFFSLFNDKEDVQLETIDIVVTNKQNADRIKALYSTLSSDVAWTSIPAFITCLQAIGDVDISPARPEPFEPEDIIWGLIIMMGIVGSELLPTTTNVNRYIVSCITYYSNNIMPMPLRFKKLIDIAGDSYSYPENIAKLSISELEAMTNIDAFPGIKPADLNILLENTEIATVLIMKFKKLTQEWKNLFDKR